MIKAAKIDTLNELNEFAKTFLLQHPRGGVIGLSGDLGAGKTTFVRTCIHLIAGNSKTEIPRVISPTFILHQSYKHLTPTVDHFDLYRLEKATESNLIELGYFDVVDQAKEAKGYVFVEWPERALSFHLLQLSEALNFSLTQVSRTVKPAEPATNGLE